MTSKPRYKASTLSVVVLGALSLYGCAGKQVWNPELESATTTFQEIAQDPLVAALAADELAIAERQLQAAQTAHDQYKPVSMVTHEAQVAQLRALTAQQRARALSANHKLQLTMGQQPLLSEATLMAAAPPPQEMEPTMAAATPLLVPDDIAGQLAALQQQLAALQSQLQSQSIVQSESAVDNIQQQFQQQPEIQQLPEPVQAAATPIAYSESAQVSDPAGLEQEMALETGVIPAASAEPLIAAAIPAQEPQPQPLPSARQLHRELLSMNARSSSRGMALTLGDRYFEGRSARLWTKRADRHLDNVAAFLERHPQLSLDIEAHTDDEASSEENRDLSIDRATAIKSQLVLRGIEESRIDADGFGESRPIAGNDNPLGRLQNRRVELIFPDIPAANI